MTRMTMPVSSLSTRAQNILRQISVDPTPKIVERVELSKIDGAGNQIITEIGSWIIRNDPEGMLASYCKKLAQTVKKRRSRRPAENAVMANAFIMMAFCKYSFTLLETYSVVMKEKREFRKRQNTFYSRDEEILKAYFAGERATQIADRHGITSSRVDQIVTKRSVPQDCNDSEIVCRYLSGQTPRTIAIALKIHVRAVRSVLRQNGMHIRNGDDWGSDRQDRQDTNLEKLIPGPVPASPKGENGHLLPRSTTMAQAVVVKPKVLNSKTHGFPEGSIYIGRGSPFGNPFRIGEAGDRATVIAKHEAWLKKQDDIHERLDALRGRDLVCFCAPLACHGDLYLKLSRMTRDQVEAWRRS